VPSTDRQKVLTSVCEFDVYACVASEVADTDPDGGRQFYPHFARYDDHRAEPAFQKLIVAQAVRQAIAPVDDVVLARALKKVDELAQKEARGFDGWWGFTSREVISFLEEHSATGQ
jgi:hypothetical protein